MSELKVHRFITTVELFQEANAGALYYAKEEADKVIADLEESHKKEVGQLLIEIAELKADYKENCDRLQTANLIKDEQLAATRHHKYKRCLVMARWCESEAYIHERGSEYDENLVTWFGKWYERWLKIAEKFKPNNEVNNGN